MGNVAFMSENCTSICPNRPDTDMAGNVRFKAFPAAQQLQPLTKVLRRLDASQSRQIGMRFAVATADPHPDCDKRVS